MNSFFLRSAWPSLTVETWIDWEDRVNATAMSPQAGEINGRAWSFDTVLLSDRSAAFRGSECGKTQRTASEAIKGVVERAGHTGFLERGWWEPMRRGVLNFVGIDSRTLDIGSRAFNRMNRASLSYNGGVEDIVITYITRQGVRRHLIQEDHEGLERALVELCDRRGWELNVVPMERLSKEEQLAYIARTTVTFLQVPDISPFLNGPRFSFLSAYMGMG